MVKPPKSETGYSPDVLLLNRPSLATEPRWKSQSTVSHAESIPFDYLGLGGRRFIGYPKQPTISIYQLVEGEYQVSLFRKGDRIVSSIFPELNLTVQEIFAAGLQS